MEWRLESRTNQTGSWDRSSHSIPIGYDEVKVISFLKWLRNEYPTIEFRVLKVTRL